MTASPTRVERRPCQELKSRLRIRLVWTWSLPDGHGVDRRARNVWTSPCARRLLRQIADARAVGATIVRGKRVDRPGFFLEPTIVTDFAVNNPLHQQEAFAPVLSFYVVNSEKDAISLASATRYRLGALVVSADIDPTRSMSRRLSRPVWGTSIRASPIRRGCLLAA
ncbi:aldehyde dehydrogenase family protein [Paraburkholderia sp. SOS3]|uniref:aldehyde dehydrogenase family protein n=1 Tax=Paraburkholderia sp. SOS3 TaxID=1926494 RepID=UPI0022B4A80B|nr:aldehyde dehydrogenase family protein [Paraburkholderia sp. SOS3]